MIKIPLKLEYWVQLGKLKAKMLLGTYPIINLIMSKDRIIDNKTIKFQYTLTFGFDFSNSNLSFISIEDALQIMDDKINTASIIEIECYPKNINGWVYDKGTYFNSGQISKLI